MLFKIDGTLINLEKLLWVDLDSDKINELDFYFDDEESFHVNCDNSKKIWKELQQYKSMLYPINPDTLINLNNILVLNLINGNGNYYIHIVFKSYEDLTYYNEMTIALKEQDPSNIDKILDEISKRS